MAAACNQVPPLDLRVNRLRATPADVAAACGGRSCHGTDPWVVPMTHAAGSSGIRAAGPTRRALVRRTGGLWVALLAAQPGERILDASRVERPPIWLS